MGTGSLQPLLRDFAREQPARWAQVFGPHAMPFLAVISPAGSAAIKVQRQFAVDQMNTSRIVKGSRKWSIQEPWVGYFKKLSEDREFQQIQVRHVRDLLKRGEYFCKHLGLKSEMAFAYMFDAVSSHGKEWLTKNFNGQEKRRLLIEAKLKALAIRHGEGRVPEADILLVIADVLASTSAHRWAANVRRRKRWFVTGEHPRAKELQGLEPRPNVPNTTSSGSPAVPRPAPSPAPSPAPKPATDLGVAIARAAEAEYLRWHPPSGDIKETDAAAVPILQEYYYEGVNRMVAASNLQSRAWQQAHPWSAVFVSWVMKGAGASAFHASAAHQGYIRAAKKNRLRNVTSNPFWAYRTTEVAPQVGDLVCATRSNSGATYDNIDSSQRFPTHCDIVTEVRPGSLRVIGGNVNNGVNTKRPPIRTLPDGRLALDGNQSRFFGVVRCRGKA
jgi:hypothetical protein